MSNNSDYILNQAVIVDSVGGVTDISLLIKELNIYEDIFANVLSGDVVLLDTMNLPSKLHLHGNEYFMIDFQTPNKNGFKKTFRIYKISDFSFYNNTSLIYKISFCSEEFIISNQKRVSKSYKGVNNTSIIRDIVTNVLGSNKNLDLEETKLAQSLIIPNMTPFEAINWISSFSLNSELSTAFLFFENKNGFNFKSLSNIFSTDVVKSIMVDSRYIINPENISNDERIKEISVVNVMNYKQLFNTLETITTGGYSSNMMKLDLFRQTHENLDFDFVTNQSKKMNKFATVNNSSNRFNAQLFDGSSFYRYFISFQGDLVDKWLLQRASQFSLINSGRIEIQLPGDSRLKCGDLVYLDFPDITPISDNQEVREDVYKSGVYLIASMRHQIYENNYINTIQLLKDSNQGQIPTAVINTVYETVRKQ